MKKLPSIKPHFLPLLGLLLLLTSCQDTIPQRSTITPGASTVECEDDQVLTTETVNGTEVETCTEKVAGRPDNAVFWKADFCACKDAKAVSLGNCASVCSGKSDSVETLYANFTVGESISLGGLGNVSAWCKINLAGDTENPKCELQAKDESGAVISLPVEAPDGTNSISAVIDGKLANDKTYILTLVETTSKSKSNAVQFIKFSQDVTLPVLGPLKNAPISQYTCVVRALSPDTGNYASAYRLHFYFVPNLPPRPITGDSSTLFCHDIFARGVDDDITFPRLELVPGVFNLWDVTDPRFYDNNNDGTIDINAAIIQKTRNFGGTIAATSKFFNEFKWPGQDSLVTDSGSGSTVSQPLGYYMSPWIDQTTFKSYCLTSTQYNSSNALFKAMRDYIGVDTEGLYIGEKPPENVRDADGNITTGISDYILIRETDLKAVWYYLNNGVPTAPTENNAGSVAVYFNYPLNKASPFVRTSSQRTYIVRRPSELNGSNTANTTSGGSSSTPTHDRKIGCVPKF